MKSIKFVRGAIALVSLLAMTALFTVPASASLVALGWLPRLQLVPAILVGSSVVLPLLVAAVLVGRVYCAVVCPLGIAQDVVRFVARLCRVPAVRLPGGRVLTAVRIALLVAYGALLVAGFSWLLDPYGIFGRFVTVGVRRLGDPGLALLAWSLGLFGAIVLVGAVVPRAWCNMVCPVGTLFGLLARTAPFRVRIDAGACVKCGRCRAACEAGAIRAGTDPAVDATRCVACGRCLGACRVGAISVLKNGRISR